MCGRLVLTSNYREKIKAIFASVESSEWPAARYNISPSQRIPALADRAPDQLAWMQWGFVPDRPGQAPLINARSETAHELPTFRDAFTHRRCIVFADGFYEWKRDQNVPRPQPYFFQLKGHAAFAIAGLWKPGAPDHCVLLTTEANTLMAPVHDRMPVIFNPDSARLWINPRTSTDTLRALLQPYPSKEMTFHPVSSRVNRATSEGEDLIKPVQIFEQGTLI